LALFDQAEPGFQQRRPEIQRAARRLAGAPPQRPLRQALDLGAAVAVGAVIGTGQGAQQAAADVAVQGRPAHAEQGAGFRRGDQDAHLRSIGRQVDRFNRD
jgi:hypothetical protein